MARKGFASAAGPRNGVGEISPERNLAVAIIRQAWSEAVLDLSSVKMGARARHVLRKERAIEWICGSGAGFSYWCQIADMNHRDIRERLREVLRHR